MSRLVVLAGSVVDVGTLSVPALAAQASISTSGVASAGRAKSNDNARCAKDVVETVGGQLIGTMRPHCVNKGIDDKFPSGIPVTSSISTGDSQGVCSAVWKRRQSVLAPWTR